MTSFATPAHRIAATGSDILFNRVVTVVTDGMTTRAFGSSEAMITGGERRRASTHAEPPGAVGKYEPRAACRSRAPLRGALPNPIHERVAAAAGPSIIARVRMRGSIARTTSALSAVVLGSTTAKRAPAARAVSGILQNRPTS